MGLPKASRLKHHRDFRTVYERGKTYRGDHLILKVLYSSPATLGFPLSPTRVGISISQKVSKKAVDRNRLKRQLRSVIRELLGNIQQGLMVIVVVRPNANECNYEHFLRELKQLLLKANIAHGH